MGRPKNIVQRVKNALGVDEAKSVAEEAAEELAREATKPKEER